MDHLRAAYDQVYVYTMGRPGFILQHVVDAFAVQTANKDSKPIGVVFGLVGLYLHVEKQFSGREVQQVHRKLGGETGVAEHPFAGGSRPHDGCRCAGGARRARA